MNYLKCYCYIVTSLSLSWYQHTTLVLRSISDAYYLLCDMIILSYICFIFPTNWIKYTAPSFTDKEIKSQEQECVFPCLVYLNSSWFFNQLLYQIFWFGSFFLHLFELKSCSRTFTVGFESVCLPLRPLLQQVKLHDIHIFLLSSISIFSFETLHLSSR